MPSGIRSEKPISPDARTPTRKLPGLSVYTVLLGLIGVLVFLSARRISNPEGDGMRGNYRDFWEFYCGAEAMLNGEDIYSAGDLGYIYPPLFAFLLLPIVVLGLPAAAWAWLGVQVSAIAASLLIGAHAVHRRLGLPLNATALGGLALLALLTTIDKVRAELVMQQSNGLVLLSFVLGLVWLDRRPMLAGLVLALGANLKYLTLIALPYLLIRRRWRAAGSLVVCTAGFALLPALYLGWEQNLGYLSRAFDGLGHLVQDRSVSHSVANVQDADFGLSIPSFASRVFGDGGQTVASLGFVAFVALAYGGAAWSIYRARRVPVLIGRGGGAENRGATPGVVAIEWAGLVVAALAFSPQTNARHFSILVLPALVGAALLSVNRTRAPSWPLVLGTAVLIAGLVLPPGGTPTRASVDWWRSVSGSTWCTLIWYLTILWTGLGRVGWGDDGSPGPSPASPTPARVSDGA